jgi:hypothetical protein
MLLVISSWPCKLILSRCCSTPQPSAAPEHSYLLILDSMDTELQAPSMDTDLLQIRARSASSKRLRRMRGAVWQQRGGTGGSETMAALLLFGAAAWGAWVWWNNKKRTASGGNDKVQEVNLSFSARGLLSCI